MLTNELKQEAAACGANWGRQEAEMIAEAIENGHRKDWPEWTIGRYRGVNPADALLQTPITIGVYHATSREYETILDRAAKAAYEADRDQWESTCTVSAEANDGTVVEANCYRTGERLYGSVNIDGYPVANWDERDGPGERLMPRREAQGQLRQQIEMYNADMYRRAGDKWEMAQNAEWPVPEGFVAVWEGGGEAYRVQITDIGCVVRFTILGGHITVEDSGGCDVQAILSGKLDTAKPETMDPDYIRELWCEGYDGDPDANGLRVTVVGGAK